MASIALLLRHSPLSSLALSKRRAAFALALGLAMSATSLACNPSLGWPAALLSLSLAWASVVDFDRFILPDVITLGLTVAGLSLHAARGDAIWPYVVGAAAGYLGLAVIALAYRRSRGRAGLGLGDAKLLAAAGAWLGWRDLPYVVLIGSLSCLAFVAMTHALKRRQAGDPIAFGPFLALGFWLLYAF